MGRTGYSGWCDILSPSSQWPKWNISVESSPKDPTVLFGRLTLGAINPASVLLNKRKYNWTLGSTLLKQ